MVASGRARRACAYLALSRRGVVRRRDSQRILSADLMGYARSFMENDADSATFLCKGPQSSLLRSSSVGAPERTISSRCVLRRSSIRGA